MLTIIILWANLNKNPKIIEQMKSWKYKHLHKYSTVSNTPKIGVKYVTNYNKKEFDKIIAKNLMNKRKASANQNAKRLEITQSEVQNLNPEESMSYAKQSKKRSATSFLK